MSPSEIAFLALGIVLGAAVGAAIVEAIRSRPAPRREVRVTIAPNSVNPRRSSTLAAVAAVGAVGRMPGSPEDDAWFDGAAGTFLAGPVGARRPAGMAILDRTRVLSGRPAIPSTAVAVPVDRPGAGAPASGRPTTGDPGAPPADRSAGSAGPRPPQPTARPDLRPGTWPDQGAPSASLATAAGAIAVLEPAIAAQEPDRAMRDEPDTRTLVGPLDRALRGPAATEPGRHEARHRGPGP